MIRFLAVSVLIGFFLSNTADASDYTGAVGKLKAVFSLDWKGNGDVSGSYYYPSRQGVTYRLVGKNPAEGELFLEEYTGSQLSARCYLKKTLSNGAITWAGKMHNTDGRILDMYFARGRATAPPSFTASEGSLYSGNVGKLAAEFSLSWGDDGSVSGTYHYPSRKGVTYRLSGKNPREGELYLEEYTGQSLTARCYLTKRVTGGEVIWEGRMENADGRGFPMAMRRARATSGSSTQNLSWEERQVQEKVELFKKIPKEVTWDFFPRANEVIEMVPVTHDGGTWVWARIDSFLVSGGSTEMRMTLGAESPYTDEDHKFSGPEIKFRIGREISFPRERMQGDTVSIYCDANGDPVDIYLHGITITHWRKKQDGKIEIRGPLDFGELDDAWELSLEKRTALVESLPFVTLVPDKLAIDVEPTTDFFARVIRLTKEFGIVVQMTDAGPGMMELESLSLYEQPQEQPWIFLGDQGAWNDVPLKQRTGEAG